MRRMSVLRIMPLRRELPWGRGLQIGGSMLGGIIGCLLVSLDFLIVGLVGCRISDVEDLVCFVLAVVVYAF
jgi:hypothetical protein